jgi:hypothetical protein
MKNWNGLVAFVALAGGVASGMASAATITFDEFGTGPTTFAETNPLRNEYAGLSFTGPGPNDGGGILNDSTWPFNAHSGNSILAFNRSATAQGDYLNGGSPIDTQRVSFAFPVNAVDLYVTTAGNFSFTFPFSADFEIKAYTSGGVLVAQSLVNTSVGVWAPLAVSSDSGFDYVEISELSRSRSFAFDDLSYSRVPAPGAISALAIVGLASARRRRGS